MNKFNKGKLIGVVAASLSAVSLMGVGFASWIITGTDDKTTGDIEVTVGDIQDKRVVFDGEPSLTDGTLVFDADGTKNSGGLVAAGDKTKKEDMEFTVKYKVKVYTAAASGWKVNAKLVDNSDNALNAAVAAKYIAYPTSSKALDLSEKSIFDNAMTSGTTTGITVNSGATNIKYHTYEVTQTFTFTWGEAFKNVNPVEVKKNDSIYTGKLGATDGKEAATTDLLVTNLQGLKALNVSGLKLQLSTALKTA